MRLGSDYLIILFFMSHDMWVGQEINLSKQQWCFVRLRTDVFKKETLFLSMIKKVCPL